MNIRLMILLLLTLASATTQSGEIYKWTDEQGRTHYSDAPPDKSKAKVVPLPPPPTQEQVDGARQRVRQAPKSRSSPSESERETADPSAGPGPLLDNQMSEYMRSLSTLVGSDFKNRERPAFNFSIRLRVSQDVPPGALLEAEFENPADAAHPLRADATITVTSGFPQVKMDEVTLMSPWVDDIRCRNYKAVVRLYRAAGSRELMGTHIQDIQSRFDSRLWRSADESMERVLRSGQLCP